jgi:Flp pilus assembly protein TadG
VVGAWLVVAMLSLIGMAALVIDVGRLTIAAQHAQNVVDAAALAGARQLPDDAAARTALQGLVQANNHETPAYTVELTPAEDVRFFGEGATVADYGELTGREAAVEVTGRVTVDYFFARIFGMESATVTRSATALGTRSAGSGDGLFFAGETNPNIEGIRVSGSNLTVGGNMHSNTQVTITGGGHDIQGDVEYRHSYRINDPSGIAGDIVEDELRPYPVDFTWAQYDVGPWDYEHVGDLRIQHGTLASGRWRIRGDLTVQPAGAHIQDCLLVVDGSIRFNGAGVILDRVTMVAGGTIRFNGTTERFSSYQDDLFAMSLASDDQAIRVNGSNSDTWGIFFAPNGGLVYNGGGQEIHRGGLVARTIDVHGGGSTFMGLDDGAGGSGGRGRVRLIR